MKYGDVFASLVYVSNEFPFFATAGFMLSSIKESFIFALPVTV